jgi:citrate lyase beta subunit
VLFVPGSRPDRYAKAVASGADRVCVDLEDAVAPGDKSRARANVVELLSGGQWDAARSIVRVNHPATEEGEADLAALERALASRGARSRPGEVGPSRGPRLTVMVPKCASRDDLEAVRKALPAAGPASPASGPTLLMIPVVETAAGVARVEEIATTPSVGALLLGGIDLTTELGAALEWDSLLYARSRLVLAAALAGVRAIDVPFLDTSDAAGLRHEADRVRRLGFAGKAAIHPDQVDVIQEAFTPSQEEVDRARRILEAGGGGEGVFLLEGRMVDRPVVEAARRIVATSEADRAHRG